MDRIERIEKLAAKQVGYTENPPGSNQTKYGLAYGFDGVPWCAIPDAAEARSLP